MKSTDSDVHEIESHLAATRQSLRQTIEALERKLSPEMLLHKAVDRVRDNGGELAGNLTHAVRDNPVPMLLTSIGLVWLMMGTRHNGHNGHGGFASHRDTSPPDDRERDFGSSAFAGGDEAVSAEGGAIHGAASAVKEGARAFAESARHIGDGARHLGDSARQFSDSARARAHRTADSARHMAASARDGYEHMYERAHRMLEEQPLLLGAVGLAAGALIGAMMPAAEARGDKVRSGMDRMSDTLARARDRIREAVDERAGADGDGQGPSDYEGPTTH